MQGCSSLDLMELNENSQKEKRLKKEKQLTLGSLKHVYKIRMYSTS